MKWPSLALDLDFGLQAAHRQTHSPILTRWWAWGTESDVFLMGYKHLRGARI